MMKPKSFAFLLFFLVVLTRGVRILCDDGDGYNPYFQGYDDNGLSIYGDGGQLKMGYYEQSCPSAEAIVRNITWSNVEANAFWAAKLLRLFFHDCFVRGCEASILLDSTPTNKAEKDAIPNLSLSGYTIIDEIKTALEQECNGTVVSCTDILALAARDAVSYQFGRSMWEVLTGRKDGKISLATDVGANIPSSRANYSSLIAQFSSKGLNEVDLVALSGAHTIGVGHCSLILNRLYNFTGKGDTDPSLNPGYAKYLMGLCPNNSPASSTVEMDPQSSLNFDSLYFKILNKNKGLFQSDAALLTDPRSAWISKLMQKPRIFYYQFARSITRMGAIGVLGDGDANGEVRRNCRVVNS